MSNDEMRMHCIQIASENLRALIATGREQVPSAEFADRVKAEAEKLLAFVYPQDT